MRLDQARLARPYAQALWKMANTKENIESWSKNLKFLDEIIQYSEMNVFLKNPTITPLRKRELLVKTWLHFASDLPEGNAERFLEVLIKNGRLFILPELIQALDALRDQGNRCYKAVVEGAYSLEENERAIIQSLLETRTGKNIYIEYHVNPDLISGFKAQIGDECIYASSEHLLQQLSEALKRDE